MIPHNTGKEHLKKATEKIDENDPIDSMIEEYKEHISKTQLKDEIYKWELVNKYKGRPNPEAEDFYQELKDVKFDNLIYPMGRTVILQLTKERPNEIRQLFIQLYDESKNLTERIKLFNKQTLKLYRELGETLQHHQDERTIATYLTFHNSDKYTFYKYSFYKKYCELLGIKSVKKNEKYAHYLDLIDELIEKYIKPDTELIKQVKGFIPDYYDGTNHNLLAQDILFQILDKKNKTNYWIFQGNPELFDFETALKKEVLTDWTISAHKDEIQVGDKVILWITGSQSGCYALAEITSEPHQKTSSPDDHLWKKDETSTLKADLKITHNLVYNPILKAKIDDSEELKNLKVGNQGTNFSAKEKEYQAILNLIENDNSFQDLRSKFEPSVFNNYIKFLRKIILELNIQPNDKRIVYSVSNQKLNFTVGQRYCLNIFLSNSKGTYGVISKKKLKDLSELYKGNFPQPFYTYYDDFNPNPKEWDSIIEAIKDELNRTDKSSFRQYNNSNFENYIFEDTDKTNINDDTMNFPLNTILYGPPGTGKTYNTILRAAEIIENREIDSYDEALKIFKANLHNQIEFITFHQNYSYEDFIQGLRPDTENDGQLTFERKDGVFKVIADRALSNIKESEKDSEEINQSKAFSEALESLKDQVLESEEPVKINKTAYFTAVEHDAFRYSGDNWTLKGKGFNGLRMKYSDLQRFFEEDIKERKEIKNLSNVSGLAKQHTTYFIKGYELVKSLMPKISKTPEKIKKKNYVIIIDEINRANISRVFGELITLIEPDKRSHGSIPLEARLPSGDSFIVPSNLYIIGTMNTADKSIALLDIALRRRFEFKSMYPLYEIDGEKIYDVEILEKINKQIIKSKGHDFQIGHSYFMGENNNLIEIMNKKVIPLLLEYYMNDEKEVKGILQSAGLEVKEGSWPLKISGKND